MDPEEITLSILERRRNNHPVQDLISQLKGKQREITQEYIAALDAQLQKNREFFYNNWETIARGRRYAAGAGAILGGLTGYLAGRDAPSTLIGAVIGTAIVEKIEHLYKPLARKFGLPQEPKDSEEHEKIARRYQDQLEKAI